MWQRQREAMWEGWVQICGRDGTGTRLSKAGRFDWRACILRHSSREPGGRERGKPGAEDRLLPEVPAEWPFLTLMKPFRSALTAGTGACLVVDVGRQGGATAHDWMGRRLKTKASYRPRVARVWEGVVRGTKSQRESDEQHSETPSSRTLFSVSH